MVTNNKEGINLPDPEIEQQISRAKEFANKGQLHDAETLCLQLLDKDSSCAEAFHILGVIASWTRNYEFARTCLEQAISINPSNIKMYLNLGLVLDYLHLRKEAITVFKQAIDIDPFSALSHAYLGKIYRMDLDCESAETSLKKAIDLGISETEFPELMAELGLVLQSQNKTEESLHYLEMAFQRNNQDLLALVAKELALPIVYRNKEEISIYRKSYEEGMRKIINYIDLENPSMRETLHDTICSYINHQFYLPYLGFNDYELQKSYGKLVCDLTKKLHPQLTSAIHMNRNKEERIRIGYISSFFRSHTVGRLTKGWIIAHDKSRFEVNCYYLSSVDSMDELTQAIKEHSNSFKALKSGYIDLAKEIKSDNLHILVYLDVGMKPIMTIMAALRLAPVQCVFWGHPQTTGMPTIDYFLSSELMESDHEVYYTEQLIKLPNISICYDKPLLPELDKNREDFDLDKDSVVYLCCQSLFKYLPQYDQLLVRIASRIENAKFVFISNRYNHINLQFTQRLNEVFCKSSLDLNRYFVMLPCLTHPDYLKLNMLSDIYLDTLGWSGGNTTLEAVACGLPVVTCPGTLMRSRHSYGILTMMGVTETIAKDEDDYVDIAVKLGGDLEYREQITRQMRSSHHRLYNDLTCVRALEKFYEKTIINQRDS
jgi:predicted O-linked N-acetylglucosamine transferase (SPINDLY family)